MWTFIHSYFNCFYRLNLNNIKEKELIDSELFSIFLYVFRALQKLKFS